MDCIFCKIAEKKLDSLILYEDDLIMIIMDAYPNVDGHCLIIPKKHYDNYLTLPDDLLLHINNKAKEYGPYLMNKLNKKSMTILNNYGDSQFVKHYHMHLLPDFDEKATMTKEEVYKIIKKD